MLLRFLLSTVLWLAWPAWADTVWLDNGDRISGEILLLDGGKLALGEPCVLGEAVDQRHGIGGERLGRDLIHAPALAAPRKPVRPAAVATNRERRGRFAPSGNGM